MLPMDSQKKPNLETTHNNSTHHVKLPVGSQKRSDLETTHNHHHVIVPNDSQKNPNLETTSNHVPPSSSSEDNLKRTLQDHQHMGDQVVKMTNITDENKSYVSCTSSLAAGGDTSATPPPPSEERVVVVEESGRERLKRHRVEMAGRVWIPDIWGHEDVLKDWIDCTVFDSSLGNNTIMSARAALVQEGRSTLRIENRC